MNTPKALIAGLVVTLGLLAATFGLEAVAQLAGPEEIEEKGAEEEHSEGKGIDEDGDGAVDKASEEG